MRMGKEGGNPAILDTEDHFWVHKRPKNRPVVPGSHFWIK